MLNIDQKPFCDLKKPDVSDAEVIPDTKTFVRYCFTHQEKEYLSYEE